MTLAVLSLIGTLLFQFPGGWDTENWELPDASELEGLELPDGWELPDGSDSDDWDEVERDCVVDCPFPTTTLPYLPVIPEGPPGVPWRPPPGWTPPTVCEPRDPSPPEPDVTEIDWPEGEIIHEAGDGAVVVGMDTEFYWDGPMEVTWTQRGRSGLREDCSLIPGPVEEFTARAETVVFDFEQGEQHQYLSDDGSVTHRYTTIPADEGEELFTVCVYVGFEVAGSDTAGLVRLAELDHDVVEIRSTLIE